MVQYFANFICKWHKDGFVIYENNCSLKGVFQKSYSDKFSRRIWSLYFEAEQWSRLYMYWFVEIWG